MQIHGGPPRKHGILAGWEVFVDETGMVAWWVKLCCYKTRGWWIWSQYGEWLKILLSFLGPQNLGMCSYLKEFIPKVMVKLPPIWGRRIWRKSEVIWVKSQVCWISQLLAEGQFGEASYVASVQRLRLIKHIRNSFHQTYELLGGGFKYFLFSSLVGEDSHFDKYFSKGLKPPNLSIHFVSICLASLSWNCRFMFLIVTLLVLFVPTSPSPFIMVTLLHLTTGEPSRRTNPGTKLALHGWMPGALLGGELVLKDNIWIYLYIYIFFSHSIHV